MDNPSTPAEDFSRRYRTRGCGRTTSVVEHAMRLVQQNYKDPNFRVVVIVATAAEAIRLRQSTNDSRICFRTATTPQSIAGYHCPVLVDHRYYEWLLGELADLASRGLKMQDYMPVEATLEAHRKEVARLTGIVHSLQGHLT